MRIKREMPKKEAVYLYWFEKLINDYGKFWLDAIYDIHISDAKKLTHICFACGSEYGTERCHIVPKYKNGSDDVSNIHLLCKECHIESEVLENAESYFMWFTLKSPINSGSALRVINKVQLFAKIINHGQADLLPEYIKQYVR